MRWLLLTLLILPALEIGVFIWIGGIIGPWWVVGLIFLSGVIGVTIAKRQGVETWNKAQLSMRNRQVPTEQIMDGICIFVGGVFLLAPGFISDTVGFTLVLPWTRGPFKKVLGKIINKMIKKNTIIYRRW
ncbi:MAG TPA: FxsA family protein [Virgibacillus sp.]|nr:FxsA family protein [Virgibacillus sp.]